MGNNQGVIFSGGTQTVTQVVAGRGARAEIHSGGDSAADRQDLAAQIETLISLLEAQKGTLEDGEFLVGGARRVAAEVAKPAPDKGRIGSLLGMLEEGTKDIASVVSVVGVVKGLVGQIFGVG